MEDAKRRTVIRFNDIGEFLADVTDDAELVERGIVRVTRARRAAPGGAIEYLLVYAGALIEGQLISFTAYVGEDWGQEFAATKQAYARSDEIVNRIRDACETAGLEVRAGAFDEQLHTS